MLPRHLITPLPDHPVTFLSSCRQRIHHQTFPTFDHLKNNSMKKILGMGNALVDIMMCDKVIR
jgi:hypothetical protein